MDFLSIKGILHKYFLYPFGFSLKIVPSGANGWVVRFCKKLRSTKNEIKNLKNYGVGQLIGLLQLR
jgi:hypothetical protein